MKTILIFFCAFIIVNVNGQVPQNIITDTTQASEYLLKIINDYRIEKGVPALSLYTNYVKVASHHTRYMALYNMFSHSQVEYTQKQYHKNVPNADDRFRLFCGGRWGAGRHGENVMLISCTLRYTNLEMKKWMDLCNESVAAGQQCVTVTLHGCQCNLPVIF